MAAVRRPRWAIAVLGLTGVALGAVVVTISAQSPAPRPDTVIGFAQVIKPILERSCWSCHGARLQLSKLDLRTREAALRGGARGPAIVPGKGEQSLLYRTIAHLDAIKMPLKGDPLAPDEIAAFKAWIDQGAAWDATAEASASTTPASASPVMPDEMPLTSDQRNYWAFQLPVQTAPPATPRKGMMHLWRLGGPGPG